MSKRSSIQEKPASKELAKAFAEGQSGPVPDRNEQRYLSSTANADLPELNETGLQMLCGLMRRAASAELGPLIQNVSIEHEYLEDDETHLFKLVIDEKLQGQETMSEESERWIRLNTAKKIHDFLDEFESFVETKDGDVFPAFGEIHFDSKIELFNSLKAYVEDICLQDTEIQVFKFGPKKGRQLKGHKIDQRQSYREEASRIAEKINLLEPQFPDLKDSLLQVMPSQGFSSATDAYATAMGVSQCASDNPLPLYLALTEQVIRHEDDLGDQRSDDFQLLHQPIKFSIN